MKVYFDPSESRDGTRLPQTVINAGQKVLNLEKNTGADLLISPLDSPNLVDADTMPGNIALQRHCEEGILIQRKSGNDLASSIDKFDEIFMRMKSKCDTPWLLITGRISRDGDKLRVDERTSGVNYTSYLGMLNAWQLRGGRWTVLNSDNEIGGWLTLIGAMLVNMQQNQEKVILPRKPKQALIPPDLDDEQNRKALGMQVLCSIPKIGPTTAARIMDRYMCLANALCYLSHPDASKVFGKIDGVGPEILRIARHTLGLDDDECEPSLRLVLATVSDRSQLTQDKLWSSITLRYPKDTDMPMVEGQWKQNDDGSYEATYTREQLTTAMLASGKHYRVISK